MGLMNRRVQEGENCRVAGYGLTDVVTVGGFDLDEMLFKNRGFDRR